MLILNEGPPRAGKSYDAVKTHILPALRAGRRVYARLNGLDHEKIADHLQLPEDRIRELLTLVPASKVVALLTVFGDDPPSFNVQPDSLIVIDEVHDFYVSSRQPLPKEQEAFFAKHGHIGLDVLIMTQAVQRLHSSIRQRVERKSVFTKQNALGRDTHYTVRFYSVGDQMGKFAKISSESHEYDPAIYPLYHGFQPGTANTGAYAEGSKTVWKSVKLPAIGMSLALLAGIIGLASFFTGNGTAQEPETPPEAEATAQPQAAPAPVTIPAIAVASAPAAKPKEHPGVTYVAGLGAAARPRYAGTIGTRHVLEWRQGSGQAIERLMSNELEALGWKVRKTAYGVVALAGEHAITFTAWPLLEPAFAQSPTQAERIRQAGRSGLPSTAQAAQSEPAQSTPGVIAGPQIAAYGGLGVGADAGSTASE